MTTRAKAATVEGAHEGPSPPPGQLTPTQMKVLQRVNSGLLNKQIAYDLGISEATVKAHMTAVMRKLNVHNRTQAAIAARDMLDRMRATND